MLFEVDLSIHLPAPAVEGGSAFPHSTHLRAWICFESIPSSLPWPSLPLMCVSLLARCDALALVWLFWVRFSLVWLIITMKPLQETLLYKGVHRSDLWPLERAPTLRAFSEPSVLPLFWIGSGWIGQFTNIKDFGYHRDHQLSTFISNKTCYWYES